MLVGFIPNVDHIDNLENLEIPNLTATMSRVETSSNFMGISWPQSQVNNQFVYSNSDMIWGHVFDRPEKMLLGVYACIYIYIYIYIVHIYIHNAK